MRLLFVAACVLSSLTMMSGCDRDDAGSPSQTERAPDNTGVNDRDRDGSTMLPTDQGTSAADMDLTQRIRQQLIDTDGLSIDAKNIKVVTMNGRVTLRGPVASEAERDLIVNLATTIAGHGNVDDQLEWD